MFEKVKVLAFDADDTLWENEPLFREAERRWAEEMREYGSLDELSEYLYKIEDKNMEDLGYGAKAFTMSLMEATLKLAGENVKEHHIATTLEVGWSLLHNPATPMPGVKETLEQISVAHKYKLVVFTKGDLLDQQHKLERSGLAKYFDKVEIVSNKSEAEYRKLCQDMEIEYDELLMVGNSFKSDIKPVLDLGGWCIYIPYRITWAHERMEEYDHPKLLKVNTFAELTPYLA